MSSAPPKLIVLKSSDGEFFHVEESIALQCKTIRHMIEDDCAADSTIPLPNVSSNILSKIIEYCRRHAQDAASASASASASEDGSVQGQIVGDEDLKRFDTEFVKVDQSTLFDLLLAANYLNVSKLLDLACQTVADMIEGKTIEEVRKIFNISSDFTPEEEAEIRRGNAWAFE